MTVLDYLRLAGLLILAAFAVGLSRGEVERWRERWIWRRCEERAREWARNQFNNGG